MTTLARTIVDRFWSEVTRVFGPSAAHALRLLSMGSPVLLAERAGRIWAVSRSMLSAEAKPAKPVRLQVETTDICNLKCIMCARESLDGMDTRTMSFDEFVRLIDAARPFYATLNGLGEPLNDKSIFEKLAALHERNIFSSMPTNGTFVYGKRLEQLLEHFPDALTISIDGATKASFEYVRKLANFEKIVANVKKLVERRQGKEGRAGVLRVLCALQRGNLFDFREMYRLIRKDLRVESFNLVPTFDYGGNGGGNEDVFPARADVLRLHAEIDRAVAETSDEEEIAFYRQWGAVASGWLEDHGVVAETNRHSCVVPWYSSYVDAKGRVYPCCYLLTTDHVMGNVNTEGFDAVWSGEKYQTFREHLVEDRPTLDGCATCPRNDDGLLERMGKYRPLFGLRAPKTSEGPTRRRVPAAPNGLVQVRKKTAADASESNGV
jgi:radical SAM protein with 4Fe4S-binding SPASM domain